MIIEIKIPSPGESITEVDIAQWLIENNSYVEKDMEIAEIESEKATLPLLASDSGQIEILIEAGETAKVGAVACKINTEIEKNRIETPKNEKTEQASQETPTKTTEAEPSNTKNSKIKVTPVAKQMMNEANLSIDDILNGLKRITSKEVEMVISNQNTTPKPPSENLSGLKVNDILQKNKDERTTKAEKMSSLRRKLSKRLVEVKNETAMLTTFNEIDMYNFIHLRKKYQKTFIEKHELKLGFISPFVKAASIALLEYPEVNAQIEGENIVYHNFADIGIAVQSPKGLMVPVIKSCDKISIAEIELKIKDYAQKAQNNRISLQDLTGGTFSITNGGTFGSMLSTPIINPPQSAILGMHNIVERPVAINGKVEIRPIMYAALSYDHRIIDGKSAVKFLVRIKSLIENPISMLNNGSNPELELLNL